MTMDQVTDCSYVLLLDYSISRGADVVVVVVVVVGHTYCRHTVVYSS